MFCTACCGEMSLASADATISLQLMFRSSPCLSSGMPHPQFAHIAASIGHFVRAGLPRHPVRPNARVTPRSAEANDIAGDERGAIRGEIGDDIGNLGG